MLVLSETLDKVYSELSLLETINRKATSTGLSKKGYSEIWEVKTEVEVGNYLKEICFYIAFDRLFPLNIPRIYLSQSCYDEIKYIPHVDKERYICTYHADSLILDISNPLGIVRDCLKRAKKIIKDGLETSNNDDFKDELGAYWTDNDESNIFQYISLLPDFPKETTLLKICKLSPTYNHIKYLLYKNKTDVKAKKFVDFVLSKGCKGIESDVLFLGDYKINSKPPFPENNEDILKSMSDVSFEAFKKYINSKKFDKYIFFTADTSSKPILLGWKHKFINTKRNGFRQESLTPFVTLSKYQIKDKIERILVSEYSNNRIENRTSGLVCKKYNFLVAGLGSVGSNLIYFLNGLNYPNFKLIDDDILKIENIGRHLLGVNNINSTKVHAIKSHIENIRPDQNVSTKFSKLESILIDNIDYFNDCDYAFIAIGNQNIENFLIEKYNEKKISIPMFFLWIEPYAIGGHCVFIHPDDKITLADLYKGHMYRFNIIEPAEYVKSNPILSKQEAGCQTSYTPYSGNDVILFLSSIYKWLNHIIQNNSKQSMVMQWTGNINIAKGLGLAINAPYTTNKSFSNITIKLNDDSQKR